MINRHILAKIWGQIDSPDILIISGARQVGKTFVMRLLQDKLAKDKSVSPEQILFFDLEGFSDRQIFENQAIIKDRLTANLSTKRYVFIDEFQRLPHVSSLLKYLRDHYPLLKFIVSGSSSLSIKNLVDESLLGRSRTFIMRPLSFSEFLLFKNETLLLEFYNLACQGRQLASAEISLLSASAEEMMTFGGYPRATLTADSEQKKLLLLEQINTYLSKDIQLLLREASLPIFEQLLGLLATQDGGLLNVNTIAKTLKAHHQTIVKYIEIIKGTFMLYSLPAYSRDKTVEISKMPKIYCNDNGYVNALNKNFSFKAGTLMAGQAAENFLLGELLKNSRPIDAFFYWRTKQGQEVDFIWKREDQIIPIEVKSGSYSEIPTGLKPFINKYHPKAAFVFNQDIVREENFAGCKISWQPLWLAGNILT